MLSRLYSLPYIWIVLKMRYTIVVFVAMPKCTWVSVRGWRCANYNTSNEIKGFDYPCYISINIEKLLDIII